MEFTLATKVLNRQHRLAVHLLRTTRTGVALATDNLADQMAPVDVGEKSAFDEAAIAEGAGVAFGDGEDLQAVRDVDDAGALGGNLADRVEQYLGLVLADRRGRSS